MHCSNVAVFPDQDAAEDRKAHIRQADLSRQKNQGLSELEAEAKERAQYLLERANAMRMEQEDEVKKLNEVQQENQPFTLSLLTLSLYFATLCYLFYLNFCPNITAISHFSPVILPMPCPDPSISVSLCVSCMVPFCCGQLILGARCHAVRDAQILERQQILAELQDEERRLDAMMEVDRRRTLEALEQINELRKHQRIQ